MALRNDAFSNAFGDDWRHGDDAEAILKHTFLSALNECGVFPAESAYHEFADVFVTLLDKGFLIAEGDEYTGIHLRLNLNKKNSIISSILDDFDQFRRVTALGPDSFLRAVRKAALELGFPVADPWKNDSKSQVLPRETDGDWIIPNTDMVLTQEAHKAEIEEAQSRIEEISEIIRSNNELGHELGDERSIIISELGQANEALSKSRVRLASVLGWLKSGLKFIAERLASTTIGEAAKALWAFLTGLA